MSIDRAIGEGSKITVRGVGPDFNLVLLNGRQMPASNLGDRNGRAFDFANLASEAISQLQVYKSSRAETPTGGIGATINVITARPLSRPGMQASIGIKGVHDTSATNLPDGLQHGNKVTPEISGIYSNTSADGRFGIGLSASYQERNLGYARVRHPNSTQNRRTHRVATVSQLNNFPIGKSPPVVYMTGQQNISLSNSEVKTLREYLIEKHGMLFGDNGGSRHFHNQFVAMMNRVLPDVRPVPIPLDDVIHRIPYQIPFLPYVAPHGGKEALGWYQDGRWVAYYHPGDIGDAWADGHAGVKADIWEACYQLGTNVIFYGHSEYSKWLEARKSD